MTTLTGSLGVQRDLRPRLMAVAPSIYATQYTSIILSNIAAKVNYTEPMDLDRALEMPYLDLLNEDVSAARQLVESNNVKTYSIGIKSLSYTPALFKIKNPVDAMRNQVNLNEARAVAIRYLTMEFDSYALYDNHNKSFLSDANDVSYAGGSDLLINLNQLVGEYQQYNTEDPIIFVGFNANLKLQESLATIASGGYMFPNGWGFLSSVFAGSVANKKMVNKFVLNKIDAGASKIGSTVKFGTNDIVLINPMLAQLFLGYEPNVIHEYTIGDEIHTDHYYTAPSLQMTNNISAYKMTLA